MRGETGRIKRCARLFRQNSRHPFARALPLFCTAFAALALSLFLSLLLSAFPMTGPFAEKAEKSRAERVYASEFPRAQTGEKVCEANGASGSSDAPSALFALTERITARGIPAQADGTEPEIVPPAAPLFDQTLVASGCGTVTLYHVSSGVTETVKLEDYVTCALLAEMPTSFSPEALKAQAIACRTYAVYKLFHASPHEGGALLCTSAAHCQAFSEKSDVSETRYAAARQAVDDTAGIVMFYDGAPILAVFHASSGGRTRSSAEVWGGDLAYLQSVETYEIDNASLSVAVSSVFSFDAFAAALKRAAPALTAFSDAEIARSVEHVRTDTGRLSSLMVCGVSVDAADAAKALALRSDDFECACDGETETVRVLAKGYGHGVGLSQCGAEDLAQKGWDCFSILSHYYTGITFGTAS